MTTVPQTLAGCIDPKVLEEIDAALGPPREKRAKVRFEAEVEVVGEGTFTFDYVDGKLTAKKGMAKGDPLFSAKVGKGGFPFVARVLQAAADGFPQSAELKKRQDGVKGLGSPELEALMKGLTKLKPMGVTLEVKGAGTYELARGALDEVTRKIVVGLDGAAIEKLLAGGRLDDMRPQVRGDTGLGTEIAAALGPVMLKLR